MIRYCSYIHPVKIRNIEDIIAEKEGKVVKISETELEFVPSETDRGCII